MRSQWKALKFLGLPSKITPVYQIYLNDGEISPFTKKTQITPLKFFVLI